MISYRVKKRWTSRYDFRAWHHWAKDKFCKFTIIQTLNDSRILTTSYVMNLWFNIQLRGLSHGQEGFSILMSIQIWLSTIHSEKNDFPLNLTALFQFHHLANALNSVVMNLDFQLGAHVGTQETLQKVISRWVMDLLQLKSKFVPITRARCNCDSMGIQRLADCWPSNGPLFQ